MTQAASVKKAVKHGLTHRLRERVGMGDSDSSDEEKDARAKDLEEGTEDGEATLREDGTWEKDYAIQQSTKARAPKQRRKSGKDVKMDVLVEEKNVNEEGKKKTTFQLPKAATSMTSMSLLEQSMPADAVLTKEGANEVDILVLSLP